DSAGVFDPQRARIVDGPQRGSIDAGDENTNNSSLARRRIGAYQGGYVGDDDSRFGQQPQLQKQRARMLENFEKGGPLKELRDDDGDEARLASRQAPDLFEHGPVMPSEASSSSRWDRSSVNRNQRGLMPGSVPRAGTCMARKPLPVCSVNQSASAVASSIDSTRSRVEFRGGGAATTASAPARKRRAIPR